VAGSFIRNPSIFEKKLYCKSLPLRAGKLEAIKIFRTSKDRKAISKLFDFSLGFVIHNQELKKNVFPN